TRHTRWPRDWSSDVCSSDLGRLLDGRWRVRDHHVEEAVAGGDGRRGGRGETVPCQVRTAEGGGAEVERCSAHVRDPDRLSDGTRSEERRVGKEGGTGGVPGR